MAYVYILRCADGSLYIGHTFDLEWRLLRHNAGTACHFTASRRPVSLVYSERHEHRQAAIKRERQFKVKVFSDEDLEKIIAACDSYSQRNAWGHDNRARVKALVLTVRYSGMRIGDVVGLQKSHLKGDKLFLNTQKSGSTIYVPLPKTAAESLRAIENDSTHFFCTGKGLRKSSVADWQRAIRRLFEIAEVTGHPHMFRHTFATDLLSKGIPIEDVSALLGHRSVRITEAYYSHWVKARRERLEERVRELWS